jgi:hypothetical protein
MQNDATYQTQLWGRLQSLSTSLFPVTHSQSRGCTSWCSLVERNMRIECPSSNIEAYVKFANSLTRLQMFAYLYGICLKTEVETF